MGLVATHVVALLQHDGVSELLEELLLLFTPLVVLIADYDRKGNRRATKETDALQRKQMCYKGNGGTTKETDALQRKRRYYKGNRCATKQN